MGLAGLAGDDRPAPNSDVALVELRTRDVGGAQTPLLGSYQRYGWNQPGPLLFYLLAGPYRLAGGQYAGIAAGALAINAAALVGMALIARRRGGWPLVLWSLALAGLATRAMGATDLADPWEPNVTVLPCALLLFLAWDAATGRLASLPFAVGVASFLVQAQAGLATFSLALLAWAAAWPLAGALGAGQERRGRLRALLPVTLWSAGTGAVLWSVPVLEEVLHRPGNLRRMWDFFVHGGHETLGLARAWAAVSLQLDLGARWLFHGAPLEPYRTTVDTGRAGLVPFALLALAGAAYLARRRGDTAALRLCGTVAVAVAAGVLSLSRLVGPLYVWIVAWTRILGLGCWLAAGWTLYRAAAERPSTRLAGALGAVLATGIAVTSTTVSLDAADETPVHPLVGAVYTVAEEAVPELRGRDGPVLVRSEADVDVVFGRYGFGLPPLALALERSGVPVVVEERWANRYGPDRAHPERATREVLLVSGNSDEANAREGFSEVATVDLLTPEQRAEHLALNREFAAVDAVAPVDDERTMKVLQRRFTELAERWAAIPHHPVFTLLARDLR